MIERRYDILIDDNPFESFIEEHDLNNDYMMKLDDIATLDFGALKTEKF
jgi:hypothetical protein